MCYDLLRDLYNKQHHWIHVIPHIRTFYLPIKLQTTVPPKNFELNSNRTKQCRRRERFGDIYSRLRVWVCVCVCVYVRKLILGKWTFEHNELFQWDINNNLYVTLFARHQQRMCAVIITTSCSSYKTVFEIACLVFLARTLRYFKNSHDILVYIV